MKALNLIEQDKKFLSSHGQRLLTSEQVVPEFLFSCCGNISLHTCKADNLRTSLLSQC